MTHEVNSRPSIQQFWFDEALVAIVSIAVMFGAADVRAGVIYAVTGAGGASSSLYTVNSTTGAATLVGATGYSHVTGLDFDPTTGTLYGVADSGFGPAPTLITIDKTTGVGTAVGTMTGSQSIPDISFDSTGQLFAWTETGDQLLMVNKANGVITDLGSNNFGTSATGMAFASGDTLYVKSSNQFHTVDPLTGNSLGSVVLTGPPPSLKNSLEFDPDTGTLYVLSGSGSGGSRSSFLNTIDIGTSTYTQIGNMGVLNISAIAVDSEAVDVVPEPSSMVMMMGMFGAVAVWQRRRRR